MDSVLFSFVLFNARPPAELHSERYPACLIRVGHSSRMTMQSELYIVHRFPKSTIRNTTQISRHNNNGTDRHLIAYVRVCTRCITQVDSPFSLVFPAKGSRRACPCSARASDYCCRARGPPRSSHRRRTGRPQRPTSPRVGSAPRVCRRGPCAGAIRRWAAGARGAVWTPPQCAGAYYHYLSDSTATPRRRAPQ